MPTVTPTSKPNIPFTHPNLQPHLPFPYFRNSDPTKRKNAAPRSGRHQVLGHRTSKRTKRTNSAFNVAVGCYCDPSIRNAIRKPRKNARRKFTKELDLCLLKEVQAAGTHIPQHQETLTKFMEVATSLSESSALQWVTDGKHAHDRYRLVLGQWKRLDKERALTPGGGEEFGEYEQLCEDLRTEVDDLRAEKDEAKLDAIVKEDKMLQAGEGIRTQAMNRRARSDSGLESEPSSTKKTRKSHGGRDDIGGSLNVLENEEKFRMELAYEQDTREDRRLELETNRMEMEVKAGLEKTSTENRRLFLDEKRVAAEERRAVEQSTGRKLSLEIQNKMLSMLQKLDK